MKIDNNFNYEIGGTISFYFSDGKNTFKISFYSISFDSLKNDLIYNRHNCYIAIYSINDVIGEELIYSSLDFDEIKDRLSNCVSNNFNEKESIEKTVSEFYYSPSYTQQSIEHMDVTSLLIALNFKI